MFANKDLLVCHEIGIKRINNTAFNLSSNYTANSKKVVLQKILNLNPKF